MVHFIEAAIPWVGLVFLLAFGTVIYVAGHDQYGRRR